MGDIPKYTIQSYNKGSVLPAEAEELFREELASSRRPLPEDDSGSHKRHFECVCAVTDSDVVLGGVHLDICPIGFGPLAREKLAYLEQVFVRPEYRNNGIATALMEKASSVAKSAGCLYIRGNVKWDSPAAIALYRASGFALADISDADEGGDYFILKPL